MPKKEKQNYILPFIFIESMSHQLPPLCTYESISMKFYTIRVQSLFKNGGKNASDYSSIYFPFQFYSLYSKRGESNFITAYFVTAVISIEDVYHHHPRAVTKTCDHKG